MRTTSSVKYYQRGLTIVELMVALTIGLILLAGIGQVFVTNKKANRHTEGLSELQQNGNFALDYIAQQVANAGYVPRPDALTNDATVQSNIGKRDFSNRVELETQAYNNVFPIGGMEGVAGASDTIVVNVFADPFNPAPTDCLGNVIAPPGDFAGPLNWFGITNTLTIQAGASGLPSLFCNGVEVVEGVENMQVLFGIDTDGNGHVDRYLTPEKVTAANMFSVMAVRIALLMTSSKELRSGDNTVTSYDVLDQNISVAADRYMRQLFTTTVRLRNRCVSVGRSSGAEICA